MIRKCTIRIELLSDMCVSDGSSYNSMIDTDICTDRYGLPYIPAKRLRGCLRECALELLEWGDSIDIDKLFGKGDSIDIDKLFGKEGEKENRAKIRLGNAYLEHYDYYRTFIEENRGHVLTHPQNVVNAFSYIRTQTSINYETGVADNNSLRTMRVADKGLVFIAEAEVDDDKDEKIIRDLERCCKILRHMGIARTRGLGEVRLEVKYPFEHSYSWPEHAELTDGATQLSYEIELLEPVICKSVNGGESNTQDYIEGAKVLGLISENLSLDYLSFMKMVDEEKDEQFICTNAYISERGKRFTEIPGFIYKIKNDGSRFVNKLEENEDNRRKTEDLQLNQMKHCYAILDGNRLIKSNVFTEERYHHRRPDDKSIGRAAAKEDGNADFYQMDSISEGQVFAGIVKGSTKQIEEVYGILTRKKFFYIGYSRSSEYGKVRIKVTDTFCPTEVKERKTKEFIICLNAPTITYNKKAMPSTDPEELTKEICATLGITATPKTVDKYIRNITLGGYNVTWKRRKPTIQAFDKGTALKLVFDDAVKVPTGGLLMIGERTTEGYGEAELIIPEEANMTYIGAIIKDSQGENDEVADASSEFAHRLAMPLLDAFIRRRAVDAVNRNLHNIRSKKSVYKPTVSNMMLMYKDANCMDDICKAVNDRYLKNSAVKKEKMVAAEAILRHIDEINDITKDFEENTKIKIEKNNVNNDDLKMKYLGEYLTQIKYRLRGE